MKLSNIFFIACVNIVLIQQAFAGSISTCLQQQLMASSDSMTVGELRSYCENVSAEQGDAIVASVESDVQEESAVARRLRLERENEGQLFSLQPHKPNYIIISNNLSSTNEKPFQEVFPNKDIHFQPWETKFQISLKAPIARDLFAGMGTFLLPIQTAHFGNNLTRTALLLLEILIMNLKHGYHLKMIVSFGGLRIL